MRRINSRSSAILIFITTLTFSAVGVFGFVKDLQWSLTSTPESGVVVQKGFSEIDADEQRFRNFGGRSGGRTPYAIQTQDEIVYLFGRFSQGGVGDTVTIYGSVHQPNRSLFHSTPRALPLFFIFGALSLFMQFTILYGLISGQIRLITSSSG